MPDEIVAWMEQLRSASVEMRRTAAERLAQCGTRAAAAAEVLAEAAGDEDEQVREWATAALEELGPPPATLLESLAARLQDDRPEVAYWSATLLGRRGSDAASAAGSLARALTEHADRNVQQRCAWALERIGPAAEVARQALQQATASPDPRLARLAQQALSRLERS